MPSSKPKQTKTPPPMPPRLTVWHECVTAGRHTVTTATGELFFEAGQPGHIKSNENAPDKYYKLFTANAATGKTHCWHIKAADYARLVRPGKPVSAADSAAKSKEWTQWWFDYYRTR